MMNINAQVTSQLTSEEICAHVKRVLAVFFATALDVSAEQAANLRTQVICQALATCGRPVAALEVEQIREASAAMGAELLRRQKGAVGQVPTPFRMNHAPDGNQFTPDVE